MALIDLTLEKPALKRTERIERVTETESKTDTESDHDHEIDEFTAGATSGGSDADAETEFEAIDGGDGSSGVRRKATAVGALVAGVLGLVLLRRFRSGDDDNDSV